MNNKTNTEDIEDKNLITRKRKCESSTLDESESKNKDNLVLQWLPNDYKVSIFNLLLIICLTKTALLSEIHFQFYWKDEELAPQTFMEHPEKGIVHLFATCLYKGDRKGKERRHKLSDSPNQIIIESLLTIENKNEEYFDEL